MSKVLSSGELLSNLNRNVDRTHHQKNKNQSVSQHTENIKQINEKQSKGKTQVKEKEQDHKQKNHKKEQSKYQSQSQENSRSHRSEKQKRVETQNKTVRSNLSRASQIINRKNNFKQSFDNSNSLIEQEQTVQNLHEILAMQIGKVISEPLAEVIFQIKKVIENAIKQRQNLIYVAYTQENKSYIQNLLILEKKKENNNIQVIQNLLSKRQNKTLDKIQNGQVFIEYQRSISTKGHLQQLHKFDVARLLKIKQGAIRSKLDLLNDKMFQLHQLQAQSINHKSSESLKKYQQQKIQQITDPHNFSLNSQKTKIANDYIKYLHQQKLLLLKKMRERQQKRNQFQKQRQVQLKQAQEMRNAAKKQGVQQRIQEYKKKKQVQIMQNKQKQTKVEQLLKEYRKSLPLYKKKEKEFVEVYKKNREKQISETLKEIRSNRRSLSLNQIKDHQEKYLQRKSLDKSKKQEEQKMILKASKAEETSGVQYFKGFFHDKVTIFDQQQKLKFYSLRQSNKMKVERMTQFGKQIRKHHKPKVDQKKKEQLEKVIELEEMKRKKVRKAFKQVEGENGQTRLQAYYEQIPKVDLYKEGNKYLEISKALAKKSRPQEVSRYEEDPIIKLEELEESNAQQKLKKRKKQIQEWDSPSAIVMQQKDMWRLRGKQLNQMTNDISPTNFHQIKKNVQVMDDKAKLKQQLLRHKQLDVHETLHQKNMLDEFYLQSIKNKIKLLNQ